MPFSAHQKRFLNLKLILCLGLMVILSAVAFLAWLTGDLPTPTPENLQAVRPSTLILDRRGNLLYEVIQDEGKQTPLVFHQIPAACWQATVAVEDSRFFQHPGVDLLAIGRAAWWNLREGTVVSGASTLTQQLARTTLMSPRERYEQTLRRKLREAWLAWRIEQRHSKEEILALYLNQVYYGNFAYGLEAAAQAYLGKSALELDLAECSLLAGLVQNPSAYNPLISPEAARLRQSTVLNLMVWHGYIQRDEAELALAETMHFAASPFAIEAPHFVSYVENQLERLLGVDVTSQGGLRVHTTLDLSWQLQAEAMVQRRLQELADSPDAPAGRRVDNAALVALDPHTGAILTLVGSPDYFDPTIDGAVNGALALRQPGSAIKPLTYAMAMDPGRAGNGRAPLTAATVIADVRTAFLTAEGEPYVPQNYDLAWHGPVPLRTALASSYNLPAVKVLQSIGVEALIEQARRQGITTFRPDKAPGSESPYGLALTLGGGEVSLLELSAAYAAFDNGGYRVEPYAIQRVEDLSGQVLFQTQHVRPTASDCQQGTAHCARPAVDPRVAYLITDILADNDARAPSFGRNSVLRLTCTTGRCPNGRPAAVKTGTTTDWRDNWTVGYTTDLVAGVWVGNADNTPMLGMSGVSGAGPIWHDFMEMAHYNRPATPFPQPEGLTRAEICIDSGLLPTQWCTRRRSELFIAGTEPTTYDTVYRPLAMGGCSAASPACRQQRVVRIYPPELQEWARASGLEIGAEAEAEAEVEIEIEAGNSGLASAPTLMLTSPDPNAVFRLSPALPAEQQRLRIAAWPANRSRLHQIVFLVNGEPVGQSSQPPYESWWTLAPGSFAISALAEDVSGHQVHSDSIWITVK